MSQSLAESDGAEILKRYKDEKLNQSGDVSYLNRSILNNENDDNISNTEGFYEALAEGSRIGLLYSATKKQRDSHIDDFDQSIIRQSDDIDDNDLVGTVRLAIAKLAMMESDDPSGASPLNEISQLLQDVEEKLVQTIPLGKFDSPSTPNKGYLFTPQSNRLPSMNVEDNYNDAMFHALLHGNAEDTPMTNKSMNKTFIHLDLSFMARDEYESYEEAFEELKDKYTAVIIERDDLVAACDSLGSRLQNLGGEKEKMTSELVFVKIQLEQSESENSNLRQILEEYSKASSESASTDKSNVPATPLSLNHPKDIDNQSGLMSPNRDKTVSPRSANKLTRELSLTKRSMEKLEAEYKTEIWELENELQRKCSTIEFLTKQVKHYQDQQGQNVPKLPLEAIESSPSPRNDDLPTERQVLNEELKKLQNYLGNLLKKFNANEAAMYAFKQDLWQRENELKSKQLMIRSLNSQINRHTEQKIEWERCNDDLKTQINQLQSEIMKLEEKLRDISTENQLLDGELRDSQHEIDNLSLDLEEAQLQLQQSKISDKASSVDQDDGRVEDMEQEIAHLKQSIDTLQQDLTVVNDQYVGLQEKIAEKDQLIEQLQKDLETIQLQIKYKPPPDSATGSTNPEGLPEQFLLASDSSSDWNAMSPTGSFNMGSMAGLSQVIDDLKVKLNQRDQQVRVQISQLQSLQDSLSETKDSNHVLSEQRQVLKAKIKELEASNNELKATIATQQGHIDSLEAYITDLETRPSVSETASVRDDESVRRPVLSRETTPSYVPVKDASFETPTRSSQIAATPMTAMSPSNVQRQQRAEAYIDELLQQLSISNQEKDNLQLELQTTKLHLQTKTQRASELMNELYQLRQLVEDRMDDISKLHHQERTGDTTLKLQMIDKEQSIDDLHSQIQELQELTAKLERDYNAEMNLNKQLKDYISKFEEKDATNDDIIKYLRSDRDTLKTQLLESKQDNEILQKRSENQAKEIADMKESYELEVTRFQALEAQYHVDQSSLMVKYTEMKTSYDHLLQYHDQDETIKAHHLYLTLQNEKNELELLYKSTKNNFQTLVHEHERLQQDLTGFEKERDSLYQDLFYFDARSTQHQEQFVRQVDQLMNMSHSRIDRLENSCRRMIEIYTIKSSPVTIKSLIDKILGKISAMNDWNTSTSVDSNNKLRRTVDDIIQQSSRYDLMEILHVTLHQLLIHQQTNQKYQQDNATLLDKIQELEDSHRQELHELEEKLSESTLSLETNATNVLERNELVERLNDYEKRIQDMTVAAAKEFASHTRQAAEAQNEIERMTKLLDHFKQGNVSLQEELLKLQKNNVQMNTMQHQLSMAEADIQRLRNQILELEAENVAKDQSMMNSVYSIQQQAENKQEEYEEEINDWKERCRHSNDRVASLELEIKSLHDSLQSSKDEFQQEKNRFQQTIRQQDQQKSELQTMLHDLERKELQFQRLNLEKEDEINELKSKLDLLHHSTSMRLEDEKKYQEMYEKNLESYLNRIKSLEQTNLKLKQNEEILEDENEKKHQENLQLLHEIDLNQRKIEELVSQNQILSDKESRYLKDFAITKQVIQEKSMQYDDMAEINQELLHEKELSMRKLSEYKKQMEELQAMKESMTRSYNTLQCEYQTLNELYQNIEKKYAALSSQHMIMDSSKTALDMKIEAMNQDILGLKEQLADAKKKNGIILQEKNLLEDLLQNKSDEVIRYQNRFIEMENLTTSIKEKLTYFDSIEEEMIAEMRGMMKTIHQSIQRPVSLTLPTTTSSIDLFASPSSQSNAMDQSMTMSSLFQSPTTTPLKSPLLSPSSAPGSMMKMEDDHSVLGYDSNTKNMVFTRGRKALSDLLSRTSQLCTNQKIFYESLEKMKREALDYKTRYEQYQQKHELLEIANEELESKKSHLEEGLTVLKSDFTARNKDYDDLLNQYQATDHRLRSIVKDITTLFHSTYTRINTVITHHNTLRSKYSLLQYNSSMSNSQGTTSAANLVMSVTGSPIANSSMNSLISQQTVMLHTMKDIETVTGNLCQFLLTLLNDLQASQSLNENHETTIKSLQYSHAQELKLLQDRLMNAENSYQEEKLYRHRLLDETNQRENNYSQMKSLINDLSMQKNELEKELKLAMNNLNDLQTACKEAEDLLHEMTRKYHQSQLENENKAKELSLLQEQSDAMKKKYVDLQVQNEMVVDELKRLKHDKDSIDSMKQSLEKELQSLRQDYQSLQKDNHSIVSSNRGLPVEFERLFMTVMTTCDAQIFPNQRALIALNNSMTLNDSMTSFNSRDNASDATTMPAILNVSGIGIPNLSSSYASRVDVIVKRCHDFKSLLREEIRQKRLLEEKLDHTEQLNQSQYQQIQELHKQMTLISKNDTDKETLAKEKNQIIHEMETKLQLIDEELKKSRRDCQEVRIQYEEEKKNRLKYFNEWKLMESNQMRFQQQEEMRNKEIVVLKHENEIMKENNKQLEAQIDLKSDQLKALKASNIKLSSQLDQSEKSMAIMKQSHEDSIKKLSEMDSSLSKQVLKLENQLQEQESQRLIAWNEKTLWKEKYQAIEGQLQHVSQGNDQNMNKFLMMEQKNEALLLEKMKLQQELDRLRDENSSLEGKYHNEYATRMKMETACELMATKFKQLEEMKNDIKTHEQYQDLLAKTQRLETEKRLLEKKEEERKKLNQLQDQDMQEKYDHETKKQAMKIDSLTSELKLMNDKYDSIRSEGNKAKKQIYDVIGQIREIVNVTRADARISGIDLSTPEKSNRSKSINTMGSVLVHDLAASNVTGSRLLDAIGMNDLMSAIEAFAEVLPWIRSNQREKRDDKSQAMEQGLKQLQSEKNDLITQMHRYEEQNKRLQEELAQLQTLEQLSHRRMALPPSIPSNAQSNASMTSSNQQTQIWNLESLYKAEKEAKLHAIEEVNAMKAKMTLLESEFHETKRKLEIIMKSSYKEEDVMQYRQTIDRQQLEIQQTRQELSHLQQEIKAMTHHRNIMKDAFEQLEKQSLIKADTMIDYQYFPQSQMLLSSTASTGTAIASQTATLSDEIDHLSKKLQRSLMKNQIFENIISTYRLSLLALYPDGSSYSSVQYQELMTLYRNHHNLLNAGNAANASVGDQLTVLLSIYWIEKELSDVKKSYDEEIRLLETETTELRNKLRHNRVFIDELRWKYEENVKSMFRSSSSGTKDDSLQQHFNFFNQSIEKAQAEIDALQAVVIQEKQQARKYHQLLIEDITRSLQMRDMTLQTLKKIGKYSQEKGINLRPILQALDVELMKHAVKSVGQVDQQQQQQQRTIQNLVKGLVEADHEVHESQRRAQRKGSQANTSKSTTSNPTQGPQTSTDSITIRSSSPPFVVRHTDPNLLAASTQRAISPRTAATTGQKPSSISPLWSAGTSKSLNVSAGLVHPATGRTITPISNAKGNTTAIPRLPSTYGSDTAYPSSASNMRSYLSGENGPSRKK